jgi:hypothetical protein
MVQRTSPRIRSSRLTDCERRVVMTNFFDIPFV